MEPKILLATLVNGLTYCHGYEVFEAGKPRPVTKQLADELLKVVDVLPVAFGNKKMARRKFVIQEMPQSQANEIVEKYNPEEIKGKKAKYEADAAELEVVDAMVGEETEDGEILLDAQVSLQATNEAVTDISDTQVDPVNSKTGKIETVEADSEKPKRGRSVTPKN